ncbi:MAG: leucine-rich repeat protein [Clostridia bacterium]|nr:leucine-rich repeat protein [Clostridia bacterium]
MKKKILLMLTMVVALVCMLAIAVSAESVHSGKVDLNATVTLDNGTVCNLFDSEGNALIWYNDADGNLQSIRADDSRMIYTAGNYVFSVGNSTVGSIKAYEVTKIQIGLESGTIDGGSIVVLNLMDDDVIINAGGNIGQPVNCVKTVAWANKVIEYAYLRLDTVAIQQQAFSGCPKLKYINLEDLTELRQIGGGQTFSQTYGQTVLFEGEVLDLRNTKLVTISGAGSFSAVPFVGIKLPTTTTLSASWIFQHTGIESIIIPTTVTKINDTMFKGCNNLTTIYLSNTTTEIANDVFKAESGREPKLEKIFFVGTKAELEALIANTNTSNNAPFLDVAATIISYEEYLALEDKSGKYAVYDYNYCEAYTEGVHTPSDDKISVCVSSCTDCGTSLVEHIDGNVVTTMVYTSFDKAGTKTSACQNAQCTHNVQETLAPLFINKGYSAQEYANGGISVSFVIDRDAIEAYEAFTGNTLKYGLFAVAEEKLGTNEIMNAQGQTADGVASVEFSSRDYDMFSMRIIGFETDAHKSAQLAIGAYVIEVTADNSSVSYLQASAPATGNTYHFVSFNNLTGYLPTEE